MSSRFILPLADVGSGIKPSSGAKLFFFEDDGVTPKDTFSDQLSTPTVNANPVIADSNGVFGDIYIETDYKVTLQDKNGTQIFSGAKVTELEVTGTIDGKIKNQNSTSNFKQLSDAVASVDTSRIYNGAVLRLDERVEGNGGGALWDAVLSADVDENIFDTIQCVGVSTISLVLRDKSIKILSEYGVISGGDVGPALNFIYNKIPQAVVKIPFNTQKYVCDEMVDIKNGTLMGDGAGGVGFPKTRVDFSGTNGIYSSTENNHSYRITNIELYGSTDKVNTTQIILDYTGQNYPYASDVRIWNCGTGIRLAAGDDVECNYGNFYHVDVNRSWNAIDIGLSVPAKSNSHSFHGGRIWDNNKGIEIPDGHSNVSFHGTAFEANDAAGIDSEGNNICTYGCRFEGTNATGIKLGTLAGNHYSFGDHFSSGFSFDDATERGSFHIIGKPVNSPLPISHLGKSFTTPTNLIENSYFEYDNNADGIPEPWISSATVVSTHTVDLTGDVVTGSKSVKINNTDSNGLRVEQFIPVVIGETYTLTWRAKAVSGVAELRLGNAFSGGTQYGNFDIDSATYKLISARFTATTDTLYLTVVCTGTDARVIHLDMFALNHGLVGSTDAVSSCVSENGGMMQGPLEMSKDADLIAQSPDGTRYKLSIANGGIATWVTA